MELNLLDKLQRIKVFVFDVDGVLTDGQLLVQSDGTQLRRMNIKDGYALQLAQKQGYPIWIISGAADTGSALRLQRLGISEVHFSVKDKLACLQSLIQAYGIDDTSVIAYMGDDMPDIAPMTICGLKCAPSDACQDIIEIADYISSFPGGTGCVRDLLEKVLKMNHHWQ